MIRRLTPLWFIGPSLILAAFIVIYPTWQLGLLSVHQVSRFGMVQQFNGLDNIRSVITDPEFQAALWRSLVWTGAVVGGTVVLSLPVALLLNERFAGRGLARVLVMLPWSVSLSMLAVVWRWALNGDAGYVNLALMQLGVLDHPVVWLADGQRAFIIEIVIGILVSIPFTTTVFLGGLSSIPPDLYEASALEGAAARQRLRTVTLPLLKPYVTIAVVMNVINVFNSFPIIWVLTQGGPANSTDILVTYLYKVAFRYGKLGQASVVSLLMFLVLLVCTGIYLRLVAREQPA